MAAGRTILADDPHTAGAPEQPSYRSLDPRRIIATAERLRTRIAERFPTQPARRR
jgi:hypothetical protein